MSPLKSANRSVNDKVWTPWMADRGEPRQTKLPRAILNSACAGPEGASPMDVTSKPSSRMERVSRVEPAAVRHAGGERSAQHRFPRGAAGIDKGSAAASLVPFTTYEINGTAEPLVNGIIPPIQHAMHIAGWRWRLSDLRRFSGLCFGRPDKASPPSGNR